MDLVTDALCVAGQGTAPMIAPTENQEGTLQQEILQTNPNLTLKGPNPQLRRELTNQHSQAVGQPGAEFLL